jgi:predicted amidohydrolase
MSLTIAAAQSESLPGDVGANVENHARLASRAAGLGAQLIVFPELSLTGYELRLAGGCALTPDSPSLDPLRRVARDAGIYIAAGAPVASPDGGLYIAMLILAPGGGVSVYAKQHVHSSEMPPFSCGGGGPPIEVGAHRIGLAICRDATFPDHAAAASSRGASVYAVGAMIDVPSYERKAALLAAYSRDHDLLVLLANYAGVTGGEQSAGRSGFWWRGKELACLPDAEEGLVVATQQTCGTKYATIWIRPAR